MSVSAQRDRAGRRGDLEGTTIAYEGPQDLQATACDSWPMVAVDGPHFACTVVRRDTEEKTAEYGVHAFGPDAAEFAE